MASKTDVRELHVLIVQPFQGRICSSTPRLVGYERCVVRYTVHPRSIAFRNHYCRYLSTVSGVPRWQFRIFQDVVLSLQFVMAGICVDVDHPDLDSFTGAASLMHCTLALTMSRPAWRPYSCW